MTTTPQDAPRWTSIAIAAEQLGLTAIALRKRLERKARRGPDGVVEAELDGVRGRKLGSLWRVMLGEGWVPGYHSTPLDRGAYAPSRRSKQADRSGA